MLSLHDVHSYYGDSHILQGVSLTMGRNQCVAILGRNGAGKTTTLRTIVGLTRASRGRITFNGRDIGREPTFRIVRSGIAYVPEDRGIFQSVSVSEHLGMAFNASRSRPAQKPAEYVYGLFPQLARRRSTLGGQLSGGEQQMLAIGRALVTGPDLLILDEPSEGLAPVIIERLEEVFQDIKASGTPILVVEQNYHLATRLADRVYVLSQGRVQFQGSTSDLTENEAVRRTYLSV
jgi:branched-chain amino acid transport system ATP-binding protein